MRHLSLDVETFSRVSLKSHGMYKYFECPDFKIQLLSYSYDFGKVHTIDLMQGEKIPHSLYLDLHSPEVIKHAHNAPFELGALSTHYGEDFDAEQWECTMVKCLMLGLPAGLGRVAPLLGLDVQKMEEGKRLIRLFSMPCRPTKSNGGRLINLPEHSPSDWETYKKYNNYDVRVEQAIYKRLAWHKVPKFEQRLWALDYRMNKRGVKADAEFIKNAAIVELGAKAMYHEELKKLTGLENPNALEKQLKPWLSKQIGKPVKALTKETLPELLKDAPPVVSKVLKIRNETRLTSVKKYHTINRMICRDGRVRGMLQFYGAGTGRWSGKMFQPQNLTKHKIQDWDLEIARDIVANGDLDTLNVFYGRPISILSELIRTVFIAPENSNLVVSDFTAIEARVTAWLAGETWRLEAFRSGVDIYKASYAMSFNVPVETVDDIMRQMGKVQELALGFGGGFGAMVNMGAKKGKNPIPDKVIRELVKKWRLASPKIVKLWNNYERAAKSAIRGVPVELDHGVKFYCRNDFLLLRLPSGRELAYYKPQIDWKIKEFDREEEDGTITKYKKEVECITFLTPYKNGVIRIDTWGGSLVENVAQAVARDGLAVKMIRLDKLNVPIVLTVHDENIAEAKTKDLIHSVMQEPIEWAEGLPINAKTFVTKFYMKDAS